jgi:hypothetical protein
MTDNQRDISFWGWLVGPHPTIEVVITYGLVLGLVVALYVYLGTIAAALFLGSLVLFFFMLKHLLSLSESNLLLVLDPEKPSVVGVHLIGSQKWKELVLTKGDLVPFITSEGTHVIFATSYDGTHITASWIHQIGRTEFLRKSATYEQALKIAEDCYKQLTLIKDIPRLMGVSVAGQAINVYEAAKVRDISTLDPTDDDQKILDVLKNLQDPLDVLKEEKKDSGRIIDDS